MIQRFGFSVKILASMTAGALLLTWSIPAHAKDEDALCQWLGRLDKAETPTPSECDRKR